MRFVIALSLISCAAAAQDSVVQLRAAEQEFVSAWKMSDIPVALLPSRMTAQDSSWNTTQAASMAPPATVPAEPVLPATVLFFGSSFEPNGGMASAAADVGGAKLVGPGTYLGVVAHLASKGVTPFQLSTKVQLHAAQRFMTFRGSAFFWTAEVGPDFSTESTAPPLSNAMTVGYAVGSGPMVSIPLGRSVYLMPHAEMVKGSLQDLGWRGGVLFGFGDK